LRRAQGVRLSPAGETFLVHARSILAQVEGAAQAVRSLSKTVGSP
jgi:DNA-binding transcriptional LysR family regulator